MKKSLLLAALLTGTFGASQAQITLTAATHMPQAGHAYYMAFSDTSANPAMPTVGANQNWDFSNVIQAGFDTVTYFNCTPQANCASFGNANLLSGSAADSSYQYFKASGSVFQTTGTSTPQLTAKLTDPLDLYRYPLTYNTQFTDAASGTATSSMAPIPLTASAKDTVKGVGYGTITTPAGTFQNVLQVRSNTSFKAIAVIQTVAEIYTINYEWFEAGSRFPVLTLSYTTTNINGQIDQVIAGTYRIPAPAGVQNAAASGSFRLVPNPATGATRLEIPENAGAEATVLITDISGKMIFQQALRGQTDLTINTADWAKGIYLVRVQNAAGQASFQKLSVQ